MEVFIDEGGQFTATGDWSVVCALAVPGRNVSRLRRRLTDLARDWPRAPTGELKGGSLDVRHLKALVDMLFAHEAILHAVAIDMSREDKDKLEEHKNNQSGMLTAQLTSGHNSQLVAEFHKLRITLLGMPLQLYVQSVLMTELVAIVVEEVTMYFSQRRPLELSCFNWTIDAKDPRRITAQESWWRDTLGPLQESRSRNRPLGRVDDPQFNYRYFDISYKFTKKISYPDKPSENIICYDIRKIVADRIAFVDSRADILIQAVDILTSFLRRLLIGRVSDGAIARNLGRLQILRSPSKGVYQNIHLTTLTADRGIVVSPLGRMLREMSLTGRAMIRSDVRRKSPVGM